MRSTAVAIVAILLALSAAFAGDLVRFRNGRTVSGRILRETPAEVTVEIAGGGTLTIPRSLIAEIVREVPDEQPEPGGDVEGVLRSEHSFLWSGDRRLGTRSLYVRRLKGGDLQLEEDAVFLTPEGKEDVRVRLVEQTSPDFAPKLFSYRETSAGGAVLLRGEMRGGSVEISMSLPGERKQMSLKAPEGMRFPLSAREAAIRAPEALAAATPVPVFDPREQNFSLHRYSLTGERRADWEGAAITVRVLTRQRGERTAEELWVDPAGRCLTEEVNGPPVVAVLSTRERVEAVLAGRAVAPSSEEERIRPEFVLPEAGFRVRKPTLSWVFEAPPAGSRRVLSMSNLRYFAYADFLVLPGAPEGDLLPAISLEMEKRFSASSEAFRKVSESLLEIGGVRAVSMIARSRNKGEEVRSLLVGFARGGRTYYVALASPDASFDEARPDFDAILASIEFLD